MRLFIVLFLGVLALEAAQGIIPTGTGEIVLDRPGSVIYPGQENCLPETRSSIVGAGELNTVRHDTAEDCKIVVGADHTVECTENCDWNWEVRAYVEALTEFQRSLEVSARTPPPNQVIWTPLHYTGLAIVNVFYAFMILMMALVVALFAFLIAERLLNITTGLSIAAVIVNFYDDLAEMWNQAKHDAAVDAALAKPPSTSASARKRASKLAAKRKAAIDAIKKAAASVPPPTPEENVPKAVECSICMERKVSATYRGCGHTFCTVCAYAAPNYACATCRLPFKADDVIQIYVG